MYVPCAHNTIFHDHNSIVNEIKKILWRNLIRRNNPVEIFKELFKYIFRFQKQATICS